MLGLPAAPERKRWRRGTGRNACIQTARHCNATPPPALARCAGVATNVSLQHFDGMGIGLVASGATYDGLQVLQVPLSAVISDTSMYNALDGKARDLVMGIPDGEDRMAAFLMLQLSAGKASPWHAYLRVSVGGVPRPLALAHLLCLALAPGLACTCPRDTLVDFSGLGESA